MAEVGAGGRRALVPILVLAAVALLVLLSFNLRNLDPGREELPPPIVDERPPAAEASRGGGIPLRDLYVAFIVVTTAMIIVGIAVMLLRGQKLGSVLSVWDLLGYALGIAFVFLALVYWPQFAAAFDGFLHALTPGGNRPTPGAPGPGTTLTQGTAGSLALLLAVGVVGAFVLLLAAIFLSRLYGVASDPSPTAAKRRRALAATVTAAIADLEAGHDFRAAVLRCYRSMLVLFEGHGLRADPSQTAREFESDALRAAGVSREGIDDLTSLFEEARYSVHPIGEPQRDAAIACLSSIRGQLEATA